MIRNCFLLLAAIAAPAMAGELWEISSTSAGSDGAPLTYKDKKCVPKDSMNASQLLDGMGACTFDRKSGDAAAMTFSMTCQMPGLPAELSSMKVSGDAKLNGDNFEMRYTVTPGSSRSPGGDFSMTGSATAHRVGQCEGP